MPWPRNRRRVRRGQASNPSEKASLGSDGSDDNLEIPFSQLRHRPIGPGELASLRAMWWRQAGAGHRLPSELDVIVIEGGAV